jgi:two-component system NarL family sensor kinase
MRVESRRTRGSPVSRLLTDLRDEITRLRGELSDARATLRAIRNGEVDAVVVEGEHGPRVYTLDGAQFDYRHLIESMSEGALVLSRKAVILYANAHFARMVERPLAQIVGSSLYDLLSDADRVKLRRHLKRANPNGAAMEVMLQRTPGAPMPAKIVLLRLPDEGERNVSMGVVVSDLTEYRRREDLLRCFSRGLMQMQETERLQVATDLGDNITQLLCSVLMRCQLLLDRLPANENDFRKEAVEFARLLRTTVNEVHRISTDLRPHGLEILGLFSAMRGVAAESAERMGLPIQVTLSRMTARLPVEVELALYRILQEALRNVERHAHARKVTVTLRRRGSALQLEIRDDGVGFDVDDHAAQGMQDGRLGLLSMRERATAVGGSLRVKSTASAGTEVRLTLPLPSKSATRA